jgi:hypothetical protein
MSGFSFAEPVKQIRQAAIYIVDVETGDLRRRFLRADARFSGARRCNQRLSKPRCLESNRDCVALGYDVR